MNETYLLTGGNIGDRLHYLQQAATEIEKHAGTIIKKSSVYETAAWGLTDQGNFLNQVLAVSTLLSPEELLKTILSIENKLGRKRIEKMGPRVIDIDILFYNSIILNTHNLIIPHPEIVNRRFVLKPLNELNQNLIHPVFKKNISELLKECSDNLSVILYFSN